MSRHLISFCVIVALTTILNGCATVGCQVQPLKPKTALRCEMPV